MQPPPYKELDEAGCSDSSPNPDSSQPQPQNSPPQAQYAPPEPQQYGQPEPQQYGQPQPQQYGQPQPQQYGQPQPQQYGQPQPQFAQPQPQFSQPQPQFSHQGQQATTVIINQPTPVRQAAPRLWSSGICDCFDDIGICCCGTLCGCCLTSQTASDMGESSCVPCCVPGAEIVLRTKWRTQEHIQGTILDDCCTVWCCGPCAMCQLAREVKAKRNGVLFPRV